MSDEHITAIDDNLYLGDKGGPGGLIRKEIEQHDTKAVISLLTARWGFWGVQWFTDQVPHHWYLPCKDNMTHDLLKDFSGICDFIDAHLKDGAVLVHCDMGISRSATAVIAWLMRTHRWSVSRALEEVRKFRKVRPNESFMEQLEVWEAVGYDVWVEEGRAKPEYEKWLEVRAKRLKEAGLTGDEPIGIQSL